MSPAIVPLSPGERPTEPGWYVTRGRVVYEVVDENGELWAFNREWEPDGFRILPTSGGWLARFYPERI